MVVNGFARAGLTLVMGMLLLVGACRSNTDRIRVLEAEKADAQRRHQMLVQERAEIRAKMLEEQNRADSNQARLDALQAQLDALREREAATVKRPDASVDFRDLERDLAGTPVELTRRSDGGVTMTIASDVTFRAGRADLNKKAQTTLQRVADVLRKQEQSIQGLRIEGHTDSDPIRKSGWTDNEELSLARAEKVRLFLISHGIDETLLSVEGHGAARPIASNSTKEGKARNRRVEIVLVADR